MNLFHLMAILISLAALFSFFNYRYLHLPTAIGLMLIALLASIGLVLLGPHAYGVKEYAGQLLHDVDFDETLLHGMLSFLLFAGALHVNLNDLAKQKWIIALLASVGVLTSTFLVGMLAWLIFNGLGIHMPFIYCLVFGALISPTDPIAVLGVLKSVGVAKTLETKIAGESLFNDGIGVVVFLVMVGIATGSDQPEARHISLLLIQEAGGGAVFGLLAGGLTFYLLRSIDSYQVEVLLTLALVMGGYAVASALHLSGPIAMVVAGLVIGNHGRLLAMSETTREHLDSFWELVDEVFNAVLFVLIGLEILLLSYRGEYLLATIAIIPAVLLARFVSVGLPITVMRRYRRFSPRVIEILTWGGLRGGISVALALSLPSGPEREVILFATYAVVVFSILVQGLTIGPLVAGATRR